MWPTTVFNQYSTVILGLHEIFKHLAGFLKNIINNNYVVEACRPWRYTLLSSDEIWGELYTRWYKNKEVEQVHKSTYFYVYFKDSLLAIALRC